MNDLGGRTTKETHVSSYTTSVDPRTLPDFNTRGVYTTQNNNNAYGHNSSGNECNNSKMNNRELNEVNEIDRDYNNNRKEINKNIINDWQEVEENIVGDNKKRKKKHTSAITSSSSSSLSSSQLYNENKDKNGFTEDNEIRNERGHRLRKKYTTTTVTTITTTTILLPKMQEAMVLRPISALSTQSDSVNTAHSISPDIVLTNEMSHDNLNTASKREAESVYSDMNNLPVYNNNTSISEENSKRQYGECNTKEQARHVSDDVIRNDTTNINLAVMNEEIAENRQGMWHVEQSNSTMIRKSSQMDFPPTLEELGVQVKMKSESSQNISKEQKEQQQSAKSETLNCNSSSNKNNMISPTPVLQSDQPWIVDEQREEVEGEMLLDPNV